MNRHGNSVEVNGERFDLFMGCDEILRKVDELAERISSDYADLNPIFVCVLNGAFIFCADFIRRVTIPCEVDFIKIASYGRSKVSSGAIRLMKDLDCTVENRHIVLVEDIVDSGASVDFLFDLIRRKNPASLKIVTLLHKPASSSAHHALDYVGFEIPSRFVIGYGLDYAQQGRNLPAIYMLPGGM